MSFSTLMYHEIREGGSFNPEHPFRIDVKQDYEDILPSFLFVTRENFLGQMTYLHENNYHTLTLEEVKDYYYKGLNIPEKSVLLTFDDCYQSIKKYAYPILKKYQFHAVAFVVTGWLHDAPKVFNPDRSVCMSKHDLNEMADVFEFANHTDLFHTRVSDTASIMMTAKESAFADDLNKCNSNEIVRAKDVFAYPFGLFTDRNVEFLREKGFKLAFTSDDGLNEKGTDPLLLKRNAIPYFIDLDSFKKILGV